MRSIFFAFVVAVVITLGACGGKSTTEPAEPVANQTAEGHQHEGGHDEHAAMSPELSGFHDLLAPLWHSEAPDRQAQTCKQGGALLDAAAKIQNAPAPAGVDAAAWESGVRNLMLAVQALMDDCSSGAANFDARFGAVHDSFHVLHEQLPKGAQGA